MKKVGIALAVLIAVLAGVVLVGPNLVDWNAHRSRIAAEIERAIGRPVGIDGDISAAILPVPTVTANAIRIANPPGFAEPDMLRMKRLEARVALLPLLRGRVQVESVRLLEPVVTLSRLRHGRANWDFGAARSPASSAASSPPASPPSLAFDRVTIENGTIAYRDEAASADYRLEKVDAQLSAGSLRGPFHAEGTVLAQGMPLTVDLDLGRLDGPAPASVQFTAIARDPAATLRFDGILGPDDVQLDGILRIKAPQARIAAAKYLALTQLSPSFAGALDLRGNLLASAKGATLRDAELVLGAMRASGSIGLQPGSPTRLDVALSIHALSGEAFDLDGLLPAPAGPTAPDKPSAATTPAFALPGAIAIGMRLSADALTYRGATIRQAAFEGSLADGVLTVAQASALLPGNSDLRLSGTLKAQNGLPIVDGRVEAQSDNLRQSLEWLGLTQVAAVPPGRLGKFAGVAGVAGTFDDLRISGLDATLDETKVTGALAYTNKGRPGYGIRLTADRLNLNAYLPAARTPGQPGSALPIAAPAELEQRLTSLDATVALEVGTLIYDGVELSGVTVDGTLFKGGLTLRRARLIDLAGLSLSAEGTVAALLPLAGVDLRLAAAAKSLDPVYRTLKMDAPIAASVLESVDLKLHLTGDEKRAGIEFVGAVAGGNLEAAGTVSNLLSPSTYDLKIRVRHPEVARLLAKVSPNYRPAGRDLKGLDVYAAAAGSTGSVNLTDIQGQFGPVAIKGAASANWAGVRPSFAAQLQTSEIDLNQLAPAAASPPRAGMPSRPAVVAPGQRWATEPLDVGWLRRADGDIKLTAAALIYDRYRLTEPALSARLDNGSLVLDQLDGGFFGGKIGMKGRLDAPDPNAAPRLAADLTVVKAQLRDALDKNADLDIAGLMDLDGSLAAQGRSEAELVRSLSGSSRLSVRDGVFSGFDLKAISDRLRNVDEPRDFLGLIGQSMSGGQTRFSALTGSFAIERGVARTDDLLLQAEAGEGTGRGAVDLAAWTIDMQTRFRLTELGNVPGFGMRLSGPLDRPQRAFDAGDLSAYVAQRVAREVLRRAAPDLKIPGITAPTEGKPGKQPEAEKVIRGLLDSLRR